MQRIFPSDKDYQADRMNSYSVGNEKRLKLKNMDLIRHPYLLSVLPLVLSKLITC
jgi:hypothetical protein